MFKKTAALSKHSAFIAIRFLSEVISRASALITFPIMAHYLGTEGYGINAQVNTLISFLVPITSLGLGFGIVRTLAGNSDRAFVSSRIVSTLLVTLATSGVCAALVFIAAPQINSAFIKVDGAETIVRWSAPLITLSSIEMLLKDYFRARLRIVAFSVIQIIQTILYVAAVAAILLSGHGLLLVIQVWVIIKAVFDITYLTYLVRVKELTFDSPLIPRLELMGLIRYGVPIMIAGLGTWFTQVGDRWVIGYYLDASQVGVYNAVYTFASILSALGSPFWSPLYPLMAAAYNQNDSEKLKATCRLYMNLFCSIGIPAFLGLTVLSNELLTRVGTNSFAANPMIFLLIAAAIFLDQVATHGYYLAYILNQTIFLRNLTLVTAGINLLLNLLLVPRIGILGAALATFIAYVFLDLIFIFRIRTYNLKISEVYDFGFLGKSLAAAGFMAAVILLLKPMFSATLPGLFALVAIGMAAYALPVFIGMRGEVRNLIKNFRS
jgi:O-antigen/teichoic acid export membrane protein